MDERECEEEEDEREGFSLNGINRHWRLECGNGSWIIGVLVVCIWLVKLEVEVVNNLIKVLELIKNLITKNTRSKLMCL